MRVDLEEYRKLEVDYGAAVLRAQIAEARLAAAGVKQRVKPLVWEDTGETWSRCDSIAGEYFIAGHQGSYAWSVNDDDAWHHGEHVESMEAAKAAAQADYDARILGALE